MRGLNLAVGDAEKQLTPACADAWMMDYEEVDCYATPYEIIWEALNGRYQSLSTDTTWQRWTSFNVARWQAWGALGFLAES